MVHVVNNNAGSSDDGSSNGSRGVVLVGETMKS